MKVLQINIVYKEKSTGRNCFEIKRFLDSNKYEGYVAYGRGKHKDQNTYRIGTDMEYYYHNIMARITGLQGYYSYFATKRLIHYISLISPDIIHLHNLHAYYLNLPLLFNFLKKAEIPVVLNLHDCWTFTGKCTHYTDVQCFKWKTQCYNCPVLKKYPKSYYFDVTKKLYQDKKRWFDSIKNITVVGVSNWIAGQAKMSFLSEKRILSIYNWVNREVFYPRSENVLNKYRIDQNKFTVLGVSTSWNVGNQKLEDFIKLSKIIKDEIQILLIGEIKEPDILPRNIKHIPFISDINELANLYSSADVYVHLSTEDTFGKVVAEAMACGTPAIVYNSTALPELIEEGCGYVVDVRDVYGVLNAIYKIKNRSKDFYTDRCVRQVAKKFDYYKNTSELIKIYESMIEKK